MKNYNEYIDGDKVPCFECGGMCKIENSIMKESHQTTNWYYVKCGCGYRSAHYIDDIPGLVKRQFELMKFMGYVNTNETHFANKLNELAIKADELCKTDIEFKKHYLGVTVDHAIYDNDVEAGFMTEEEAIEAKKLSQKSKDCKLAIEECWEEFDTLLKEVELNNKNRKIQQEEMHDLFA